MDDKVFYALVTAVVVIGGIGIGVAYSYTTSHPVTTTSTGPYYLTLVITPSNPYVYNSTYSHDQPSYFVLAANDSLESAANIVLPAHREIVITIIDYDSGPTPNIGNTSTSNSTIYTKVIGTVGNVEYQYNATIPLANYSNGNTELKHPTVISQVNWFGNSTGAYNITHTFTIINNGNPIVNIPTYGGTTTLAYVYLNNTGTYDWQCYVPCGLSAIDGGWSGAMTTVGWMTGTVVVD